MESLPSFSLTHAFLAGLLALLTPSGLAFGASALLYLIAVSRHEEYLVHRRRGRGHLLHGILFLIGFGALFVAWGASSETAPSYPTREVLRYVGSGVLVAFGMSLLGRMALASPSNVRLVHGAHRWARSISSTAFMAWSRAWRYVTPIGSLLVGGAVATAWTPCVGSTLESIFLALDTPGVRTDGAVLLLFYTAGLCLPLILAAGAMTSRMPGIFAPGGTGLVTGLMGAGLVVLGMVLANGYLTLMFAWLGPHGRG